MQADASRPGTDHTGWGDVTFNGSIRLDTSVSGCRFARRVSLSVFAIHPVERGRFSLPATVMQFKVTNTSKQKVESVLTVENAVAWKSGETQRCSAPIASRRTN